MRIRTIKPTFWTSEDIASLPSDTTRLLFIGLWNYVDDDGRGQDNPALIRAALFPLDDRTLTDVDTEMARLQSAGLIVRYSVNGRRYLHVKNFDKHQVINRKTRSQLPEPPLTELHVSEHGAASVHSHREGKGREEEGKGREHSVDEPERPSLELVVADVSPDGDRTTSTTRIFDAWVTATGKTRAALDPKRKRIITAALKNYPEADLIDAVKGWRHDPFHRGENDRHTAYNDLGLLLRDAAHIEKFRDLERTGPTTSGPRISKTTQSIAARMDAARAREAGA